MDSAEAKKQRRAARACDACRGRKIRCTGVDAGQSKCKRCSTMSLDCTFDVPVKRPLPSGQVEQLQARIAFLEAQLAGRNLPVQGGLSSHPEEEPEDSDDGSSSPASSSSRSPSHSNGVAFIPSYIPTSDVDRTCPGGLMGDDDHNAPSADQAASQGGATRSAYGHLGSSSVIFPLAAARQIPRTYKSIGLQMADQLRKRVRLEYWQWDCSPIEAELDKDPHLFWPSTEEAVKLFDAFFDAKGAAGPTMGIDAASLRKEYAIGPTGGISKVRAARIYVICALSAWHCQLGLEAVNNRSFLAGLHWWLASRRLLLALGNRYDQLADALEKAQTYVLQAAFAATRPMLIQNSWHTAGDAIRVLVDGGLHRKSILQELTGKSDERQKTFWASYVVEKVITLCMGRCSMLSSEWFDAEPPRAEEDWVMWCEVESMMLTEAIMKAKYACRGPPASSKSLRKIEARLESLHSHLSSYGNNSSFKLGVQRLHMMVDSVELLYLAPNILAPETCAPSLMDNLESKIRRILEQDLDVSQYDPFTASLAARAVVLVHVLSRPHQPDNVRNRFAAYTTRSLGWLRRLEGRFMHAGKVGDMLVLPLIVEQEEKAESNGPSDRDAHRRKRSIDGPSRSSKRQSTGGSLGAPSPADPSPGSSSASADPIAARGSTSEYPDMMNNGLQLPPLWSSTPQASNSWSPRAQAPMSFSRTGSQSQAPATGDFNALFASSPSATWSTSTPSSKPLTSSGPPSSGASATSNPYTPLPPFDTWPAQKDGMAGPTSTDAGSGIIGGVGPPTGPAAAAAMGTGNLDFASMDSVDLSRLLFDYDLVPNLTFMEGWT